MLLLFDKGYIKGGYKSRRNSRRNSRRKSKRKSRRRSRRKSRRKSKQSGGILTESNSKFLKSIQKQLNIGEVVQK